MEEEEIDPLGLSPHITKKVDIIAKCSVPKQLRINDQLNLAPNKRTRRLNTRTKSTDILASHDKSLKTLFQEDTDIPQSPEMQKNIFSDQNKEKTIKSSDFPDVDYETLLNYDEKLSKIDYECIIAGLEAQLSQEQGDLDDTLSEIAMHGSNYSEISEKIMPHKSYDIAFIRYNAIKAALYEELAIKKCNKKMKVTSYNIQLLNGFIAFLKSKMKGKKQFPGIDLDKFLSNYLQSYKNLEKIDRKIRCLEKKIKPITDVRGDAISNFLSPHRKSGRVVATFMKKVNEMKYNDLRFIISAICPSDKYFGKIRAMMFDLAWQCMPFPFASVSHITFPKIFDLTPRSINPQYLEDVYLDTPFRLLNHNGWPLKFTEDYFFTMMCMTNPFAISNRFCEMIQVIANTLHSLAVSVGGEDENEVEIGFDLLFAHMLVCVYAFGCPGILDTLEYCSKFIEETTDPNQQFAMTHCAGIVAHVKGTSTENFRRRVKLNKIPILHFKF